MHLQSVATDEATRTEAPRVSNGVTSPTGIGRTGRSLSDVIAELGLAPRERVDEAINAARSQGTSPEAVLLEWGDLSHESLSRAVAERHGLEHLDLALFQIDMAAANLVSTGSARRYAALPVAFVDERTLLVAMSDPANVRAVDDLAIMTGYEIRPAVASREDIESVVGRLTQLDAAVMDASIEQEGDDPAGAPAEIVDLRESADDAPVIKLVNQVVAQAVDRGASDVHLEPDGTQLRVRFRIDGVLVETANVPRRMVAGVVSRVKIMSALETAARRLPQDGRVGMTIDGHHVALRVVTLPSVHGESVVMRILDKESIVMDLDKLGMAPAERERFRRAFNQSFGAVLVTGPTGSGKSTSLYAALTELNAPDKNIITIEDPVEYQLEGITQVQVNPKAGL